MFRSTFYVCNSRENDVEGDRCDTQLAGFHPVRAKVLWSTVFYVRYQCVDVVVQNRHFVQHFCLCIPLNLTVSLQRYHSSSSRLQLDTLKQLLIQSMAQNMLAEKSGRLKQRFHESAIWIFACVFYSS